MNHKFFRLLGSLFLALAMTAIASGPMPARAAGLWFVSPAGDDSNDCLDPGTTCATINGALSKASSGDIIYVAVGTYIGTGNEVVLLDKGVTLSGGWDDNFATQGSMSAIDGGGARRGIFVNSGVVVTIEYFVIQNGFFDGAFNGGGGIRNDGDLILNNSTISNNSAINCGAGGNIYNTGTLSVNTSTIQNGSTVCGGGALENSGTTTLTDSTVKDNSGVTAIDNDSGILTLNNSTVSGTTGSGLGIANFNGGTVNLNASSVSGNLGAGFLIENGPLTLNNSSVHNNSGGGIYVRAGGVVTTNNSTVSRNGEALSSTGGIYNESGGTVYLNSSTIANNIGTHSSATGGISNFGTVTMQNSILTGNIGSVAPDCSGSIDSAGYNLVGNTSSCTFTTSTGDLTNVDAKLGLLIGSPAYHPLAANSPAIDAGNPTGCTGSAGLLTTDQRGATRAGRCDIGAYEYATPGPATSISAYAGSLQRTPPLSAFKTPLQVLVVDEIGSPISNVVVTFTAPGSGPSGTFADSGTFTTTATTNETGIATAATLTANGQLGNYNVTATTISLPNSAIFSLTNAGWFVTPTGDDSNSCASADAPCLTVTGAIGKASSGDMVNVAEGTYTGTSSEVVLIDKDITLSGGWDTSFTTQSGMSTIDGEGTRRGITVSNFAAAVIERFDVQNGFTDYGGGIANGFGPLTLNNSVIRNNTASNGGGGIYHYWSGVLELNHTVVSNNIGGGILNDGDSGSGSTTTLNESRVESNNGYGISNFGSLVINNSTITGNTGVGVYNHWHDLMINNSTISNNIGTADGGGLYNYIGSVVMNNTTVSGNSATDRGGGISVSSGTVLLNNSTVSANMTTSNIYGGGGIYNSGATVILQNTLLAGNTTSGMGPDCHGGNPIESSGYNIIGNTSNCGFISGIDDWTNIDPLIGPLQDNGGSTFTHELLSFSPAIDTGNPAGCRDQADNLLTTDQRGIARPQGVRCDIGAFEFDGTSQPAANDNFADAEVINSLPYAATTNISGTGVEADEPQSCPYAMENTVWYSFTPIDTMMMRVESHGNVIGSIVGIYGSNGPGISNLQFLTCTNPGSSTTFLAEANQTYYLQVSGIFGEVGIVHVSLEEVLPSKDNFADAELISSLPFSATVDITDATNESGEPQWCTFMERTVWYSFTPTQNVALRVDTLGGAIAGNVNIYIPSGPGISDLNLLGCSINSGSFIFYAEAGNTYYLQAGSAFGEVGSIQINMEEVFPPANDNFTNSEIISSVPSSITVDVTDATNEPNEPQFCAFLEQTVWYSFTPADNTAVRADTLGSAVSASLNIYQAAGPGLSDLNFIGCSSTSGSLNFFAEAGSTYYIQAGASASGQVGTIQINLEQISPPANDNFTDAESIDSLPFSATVDVTNASSEAGESAPCTVERSVWYVLIPAESMVLRANTEGSAISALINIYQATGSGISDLQHLGCASSGNPAIFLAEAGQTYYLQAGAFLGGDGSIQVNLEQIPSVANDDFDNAVNVGALPFSDARDTTAASSAADDPVDCFNNGSVWYQFTAISNTSISANTFGSDYDTTLAVYTGSRGALEMVPGGCNDDFSSLQSRVDFNATAGTTYYFMVGFCCGNGAIGGGNLVFSVEQVSPPSMEVTIDIKPGSLTNPINPNSLGKIPVTILSTSDFNAITEIDKTSLTFGSTGDEHSLVSCNKRGTDVNGDGLKDLVCHFKTKLTGFVFGDTEGILKGQTLDGVPIEARDVVRILGASYP